MRKYLMAGVFTAVLAAAIPQVVSAEAAPVAAATDAAVMARKEALVRRYFVAVNIDKTMDAMMKSMAPAMFEQMRKSNPSITAETSKAVSDATIEAMAEIEPKYMSLLVDIYADAFTEDELTQLVDFYESPVGRSVTAKTPALAPKVTQVMVTLMPEIQASIKAKTCAKIACPTEKSTTTPKR
jgi:hypothetical protein